MHTRGILLNDYQCYVLAAGQIRGETRQRGLGFNFRVGLS